MRKHRRVIWVPVFCVLLVLLGGCGRNAGQQSSAAVAYADMEARDGRYLLAVRFGEALGGLDLSASTFTLFDNGEQLAKIEIPIEDWNLVFPMDYDTRFLTLDAATKTAVLGNYKLTYYLDFNTGAWKMTREYKSEMVEWDYLYAENDRYEIRDADLDGGGDGYWADIVAVEKSTGKITFLTYGAFGSYVFAPENILLASFFNHAELINVEKAEIINGNFGTDCEANDCCITGIGYDEKKDWFLFAWRAPKRDENGHELHEEKVPVMMDIYTREGGLVRTLDTGLETYLYGKIAPVYLEIELDGKGNAKISESSVYGFSDPGGSTFRYWE